MSDWTYAYAYMSGSGRTLVSATRDGEVEMPDDLTLEEAREALGALARSLARRIPADTVTHAYTMRWDTHQEPQS